MKKQDNKVRNEEKGGSLSANAGRRSKVRIAESEKTEPGMSGEVIRTSGIGEDVAGQKQTIIKLEDELKQSDALLRIAGKMTRLGGWNVILGENRSYWSDEVARIHEMPLGYSPLVAEGINYYAPEWRDRITEVFTRCVEEGIPYDEEMQIITATGRRVWVRTVGEAIRDDRGEIYKIQGAFQDITDKKQEQEKLREKDEQFRKLSANVHDLIFQFTRKPDGTYIVPIASEGIRNIFGCSPEDVAEDFSPIARVIHPDDMERVIADIEYSAKHLSNFTCEFRVKIPGKPIQWIFSRSTPELMPDGGVTWFGFNADITYRKQIEEALSESEKKFRKIYKEGPFGIALANGESKFIMANEAFCNITGYTELELLNMSFREITHPDDRETGMSGFIQLVQRQIPVYKAEKRYIRKDGRVIWGSVTVTPVYDEEGRFSYNLAIVEDISERKKAVDDVIFLNNKLVILIDAIQELAASTSMSEIMKTVHLSARQLVNADGSTFIIRDGELCYYADEDAVGPLWKGRSFPMDECISGWAMIHKQAVVIEDIYSDSRIPLDAYRSTFVKSLAIAPIRKHDPLGAIGAYWATNYLVSETEMQLLQTLADAAAKAVENIQLIEGLEKTVSDRTAELLLLNKEMEAFSYSVSHDLRAPLRHINGFSEILVRQYATVLPEEAKKYFDIINASAQKMGILIDDLLNFSRTGRAELKKSRIMMKKVVTDSIAEVVPSSGARKVKWDIKPLPAVYGDYNLLKIVWINLIDNAYKYTRNNESAEISIGYTEEKENYSFYIKDNGVGFDMKYAQKLFGVFQRMHSEAEFEGTGIGLANVRRIIHRHGGNTWAEAEQGKGATFYFSLPKQTLPEN